MLRSSRPLHELNSAKSVLPAISSRFLVAAYSTKSHPPNDTKKANALAKEAKAAGEKLLEARPGEVTVESSRRHLVEPYEKKQTEPEVGDSLTADVHSIQEALALTTVPRETYALGLSGTIPYFVTSLSTVYLGWNLRHAYPTSSAFANSFLMSHDAAQYWLQLLEPIQLGYGAVILSFLGAVHWGMEFNEKTHNAERAKFRYTLGVLAPALAWPTLFMPVHFALTGQFLAFTLMYFADSRATKLGWVPPWYGTYRFVLTFIVGSAILISLIFRAKIDDVGENMTARLEKGMHQRGQAEENFSDKWARLEQEDKEKAKKEAEEKKKQEANEKKEAKEKKKGDDDKGSGKAAEGEKSGDGKEKDGEKSKDNEKSDDDEKDKPEDNDSGHEKKDEGDDKGNDDGDEKQDSKGEEKSGDDGDGEKKDKSKDDSKKDDDKEKSK
ncbi:hypothetical protein SCUCBS95973_006556 [Sporothrix curviconia]|uniref:Mitochondrial inner membrane protein 1 protein n=1 Tax=Sporothrix curviconia TaxID=1260050 RepID=A0ABP0C636_9PEZI